MVSTNAQPIVGANGDIYTAPTGTPAPSIADWDAIPAPWTKLGMVSDDGVSWTPPEEESTDINIWQSMFPARTITTGLTSSMGFALDGWDRVTVPFAMGGGEFEDVAGGTVIFHPPKPGEQSSRAIFVKVLDGDPTKGGVQMGLYFAKGHVTGRDDTVFKKDEAALLNVTFGLEVLVKPDGSLEDPYQLVFDPATFPAAGGAVAATGATAGVPGTFTPSGATAPANLAAMSSIVASPLTAWTTGQYVATADLVHCHWDADSWETGDAP